MDKKSPFFTATIASILFLTVLIILKYFLLFPNTSAGGELKGELPGAIIGTVIFWLVIFVVHQYLKRRFSD
ncbi:Uncharacterised protein [uncultured archaeon]|nr:Uncharacterised protein [uncultured archaeon]